MIFTRTFSAEGNVRTIFFSYKVPAGGRGKHYPPVSIGIPSLKRWWLKYKYICFYVVFVMPQKTQAGKEGSGDPVAGLPSRDRMGCSGRQSPLCLRWGCFSSRSLVCLLYDGRMDRKDVFIHVVCLITCAEINMDMFQWNSMYHIYY